VAAFLERLVAGEPQRASRPRRAILAPTQHMCRCSIKSLATRVPAPR
jgi:hypothetical protein